jgi:hypothetical protein
LKKLKFGKKEVFLTVEQKNKTFTENITKKSSKYFNA